MPVRDNHVEWLPCGHSLHPADGHGQFEPLVNQLGQRAGE
jgi:hypothetical protein